MAILQLVFTSGTLTVRGECSVGIGDNFSEPGRPYMFTAADGILVERHELVSVRVLTEEELNELDLSGLPLRVDGDQNWRSASTLSKEN